MKKLLPIMIALVLISAMVVPAYAYENSVTYTGQGLIEDGYGSYDLDTEICGLENGADADGPYMLWVLTATSATQADITGPWGTAPMTQSGKGTYKYISGWYNPDDLVALPVTATYDGLVKNAQLVISHGCRPFTNGAWCSPGFWKNAKDAAWEKTGISRTDLFNDTVFDVWYGASFAENPTLQTVLDHPQIYSGPPNPGTSGHELNAYNAVGAFLTNHIPGYQFNWYLMEAGGSDACPLDHSGDFAKVIFAQRLLMSGPVRIMLPLIVGR